MAEQESGMVSLEFVGVAHTPYARRADCPRGPDPEGPECTIEVLPAYHDALLGMDDVEVLDVLLWFHEADRSILRARRRGDSSEPERGVFALRAPDRPNPVAVSRVPVLRVEEDVVVVRGLDAVDGTPVVDLKPAR